MYNIWRLCEMRSAGPCFSGFRYYCLLLSAPLDVFPAPRPGKRLAKDWVWLNFSCTIGRLASSSILEETFSVWNNSGKSVFFFYWLCQGAVVACARWTSKQDRAIITERFPVKFVSILWFSWSFASQVILTQWCPRKSWCQLCIGMYT